MTGKRSPWVWTLATTGVLAAGVVAGSIAAARRVERIVARPPGNRVDEAFRQMARQVTALEALWRKGLQKDSQAILEGRVSKDPLAQTAGVTQQSILNPSYYDPARATRRIDGRESSLRPVLENFARGESGEWRFKAEDVLSAEGWLEEPGRPLAWVSGNGRIAVVLMLDADEAARTAEREMKVWAESEMADVRAEPGWLEWTAPGGNAWLESGSAAGNDPGEPQEILRHVSRFGDWTLRYHYPVRELTAYRTPVLAGGFSLGCLLLLGGGMVAHGQRRALKAAEQRVSFVNRVSHELRTPLTNLLLNTDLALDDLPASALESGRLHKRLERIREETARLSRIVDNVLAFAQMERGGRKISETACDVPGLIGEVRQNFGPLFERKSISCDFRDEGLPSSLAVDRDALAQIVANLLSNVEKYAGEGASAGIAARLESAGSVLVVEVSDDGPGVPSAERERIFRPFVRADSRTDEGVSGAGLGLAISRELAELLGGSLELIATARGARFRLQIPVAGREKGDAL